MNHHNDPNFLLALWTEGPAKGFHIAQSHIVFAEAGNQNLDQAAFPGLEIAKKQIAALAVDINDLSGAHAQLPHYLNGFEQGG